MVPLLRALLAMSPSFVAQEAGAAAEPGEPRPSPPDACLQDLEYLPAFLLSNDAGAPDHLAQRGQGPLDRALDDARRQAGGVASDAACDEVLRTYLRAWRPGHLGVSAVGRKALPANDLDQSARPTTPSPDRAPTLRVLSRRSILLGIPTFDPGQATPLRTLLETNRKILEAHPVWILDIRSNDGGADSTYEPLLEWIQVNDLFFAEVEFLATPAILEANERLCAEDYPGNAACEAFMAPVLAALRKATPGTFVRRDPTAPALERMAAPKDKRRRPRHVGVLVDRGCGSSCEQFVLAVRQSANVKLFGRRTSGCLDYSNVRPHLLPSGRRRLHFATTRSLRLPHQPVDAAGIAPDVYLPPAEGEAGRDEEVETVRALLEPIR